MPDMHLKLHDLPRRSLTDDPDPEHALNVPSPKEVWSVILRYSAHCAQNGQTNTSKELFLVGAQLYLLLKGVDV